MKQGRTLTQLATELDRQHAAKEDLIARTDSLVLSDNGVELIVGNNSHELLPLAHRQIGERVGIPYKYYSRMAEVAPDLLANNVNHWFYANPESRMIRLMDNKIRAFLSDRYQRRDNFELMQFLLPVFTDIGGLQVTSCDITDHKMYLKLTTPRIQTDVREGDTVQAGIVISNSEVGLGAFRVQPLILRLVCMNGMVSNAYGISKYHIGKRIETESDIQYLFSDETLAADDEAFFLKARDIVKGALSEETFTMIVNQLMEVTGNPIIVKPKVAVEKLQKKYALTQDESDMVLQNLLSESDLTQYGMVNGITATAKDEELSYDRATELEELAGNILYLSNSEWKEIAA